MEATAEKVLVWQDEVHQADVKQQIQDAQKSLQQLLNTWAHLDIGQPDSLHGLVMKPQAEYDKAINKLVEVPQSGRFQVNLEATKAGLVLPDSTALYAFAARIRQQPWVISSELFELNAAGRVEIVDKEAAFIIAQRSIYAKTPAQVNICRQLQKLCDQLNSCNRLVGGELIQDNPWFNTWIRCRFKIWQSACNAPYVISIDPEYLRSILK